MDHLLPEVGHVRITTKAGRDYTFRPALSRVAALGDPIQIVAIYGDLHKQDTACNAAAYVLATMSDEEDCTELTGWIGAAGWVDGEIPAGEMVIIARHLMMHGIAGKARPGKRAAPGEYSPRFDVAEHVAAAVVHLGVTRSDALAMTMTEIQLLVEAKYPDAHKKAGKDYATRDEYRAQMAAIMERRNKALAKAT